MKNLITALLLFFTLSVAAQDWQMDGTKYPNAVKIDTPSVNTKIPVWDNSNIQNYFADLGDLLELVPLPDLSNYVTIDGNQTITGLKTHTRYIVFDGNNSGPLLRNGAPIYFESNNPTLHGGIINYSGNSLFRFDNTLTDNGFNIDFSGLTSNQTYITPNKSGTIALLDDVAGDLQSVMDGGNSSSIGLQLTGNSNIDFSKNSLALHYRPNVGSYIMSLKDNEVISEIFLGAVVGLSPYFRYNTGGGDFSQLSLDAEGAGNAGAKFQNSSGEGIRVKIGNAINDDEAVTLKQMQDSISANVSPALIQETGTFTPTLLDAGGGRTYTIGTTIAEYVKTGNVINITIHLQGISQSGVGTGVLRIEGLPFESPVSFGRQSLNASPAGDVGFDAPYLATTRDGQTYLILNRMTDGQDFQSNSTNFTGGSSSNISITGSYLIN